MAFIFASHRVLPMISYIAWPGLVPFVSPSCFPAQQSLLSPEADLHLHSSHYSISIIDSADYFTYSVTENTAVSTATCLLKCSGTGQFSILYSDSHPRLLSVTLPLIIPFSLGSQTDSSLRVASHQPSQLPSILGE